MSRPALTSAFLLSVACAAPPRVVPAPTPPPAPPLATIPLTEDDRTRLAETFRLGAAIGNEIWQGWTSAPFAVLLVTADREYLLRHPRPSADFKRIGYDSLLATEVFMRARTHPTTFLATFPAVGSLPTIVVGQPAATRKASTEWVITLLHEHFHQLQYSRPGYYAGVDALGLSRGDQTGMWMLNYPFPYDSVIVASRFAELATALDSALSENAPDRRPLRWRVVLNARTRLKAVLTPPDDRYLAFQMWQEGVARYTELQVARWAGTRYSPSERFRALADFTSYAAAANSIEAGIRNELRAGLPRQKRVAFYALGASMALMLDREAPGWRGRYFDRGYSLDALMR